MDGLKDLLSNNPLYIGIGLAVVIVVVALSWNFIKAAFKVLGILALLAAIAGVLFWLKSLGP